MQSVRNEIELSNEQDARGVQQLETAMGGKAWVYELIRKEM